MQTLSLTTPDEIATFRLIVLQKALKLEILGMKRRGRSVYSIIKSEFGFRGSKQAVYDQLTAFITNISKEN